MHTSTHLCPAEALSSHLHLGLQITAGLLRRLLCPIILQNLEDTHTHIDDGWQTWKLCQGQIHITRREMRCEWGGHWTQIWSLPGSQSLLEESYPCRWVKCQEWRLWNLCPVLFINRLDEFTASGFMVIKLALLPGSNSKMVKFHFCQL